MMMNSSRRRNTCILAVTLILLVVLSAASWAGSRAADLQGHWAELQVSQWMAKGLIAGYPDGSFQPDRVVSRAEFIALINHSYGFTDRQAINFSDVSAAEWYSVEIAKAVAAGYISGYPDGTFRPGRPIERQEAAYIIARLLNLEQSANASTISSLLDMESIPSWSRWAVETVEREHIIQGYPDHSFQPFRNITRAEAVVIADRARSRTADTAPADDSMQYEQAGVYGPESGLQTINGTVAIKTAGINLRNMEIKGDLILTAEIDAGEILLTNITVQGNTSVQGSGALSLTLADCTLAGLTVGRPEVGIVATGDTAAQRVQLESGAKLEERQLNGLGFELVTIAAGTPEKAKVILIGDFADLQVSAPKVVLQIAKGTIGTLNVVKTAGDAGIDLAAETRIETLILDAPVAITGKGTISSAQINAAGSKLEPVPAKVVYASGVTALIGSPTIAADEQKITISNIQPTNTLGKFRFDTDRVTSIPELQSKILADGAPVGTIAKRNSGASGQSWNAFVGGSNYLKDHDYTITCLAPFTISGANTVSWSSSAAAPAAGNVKVQDIGNRGNGSDLEVSFSAPSGENTRISLYRIMVVKSEDAPSFDLPAANLVASGNFTIVPKTGDSSYSTILGSKAKDVAGTYITGGGSYRVFILSVADGTNATENALSVPSNEVTLETFEGGTIVAPLLLSSEVTAQGDISLTFDKAMAEPAGGPGQFVVTVNATPAVVTAVQSTNTPAKIKLVLAVKAAGGQTVTVAYSKGSEAAAQLKSTDGGVLESFAAQPVSNPLPVLLSAATNTEGTRIILGFSTAMANPAGKAAEFTVLVNGTANPVSTAELNPDPAKIELLLTAPVGKGDLITVTYTPGTVKAADNGALAGFTAQPVTNTVPESVPTLASAEVTSKGDISLTFNQAMAEPAGGPGQFSVSVNGSAIAVTVVESTNTPTKLKLVLAIKVTGGQTVTIAYSKGSETANQIRSAAGGILESFAARTVSNLLG